MTKRRNVLAKKQRTEKRAKLLLGVFVALLMVSSTFGIVMSFSQTSTNDRDKFSENGVDFQLKTEGQSSYFEAEIDGNTYQFFSLPSQTTRINMQEEAVRALADDKWSLTFVAPENITGAIDLVRSMLVDDFAKQGKTLYLGVANDHELYSLLPKITCANATEQNPVVELRFGQTNELSFEQNCITASATSAADMLLIGDAIRFARLGVLP